MTRRYQSIALVSALIALGAPSFVTAQPVSAGIKAGERVLSGVVSTESLLSDPAGKPIWAEIAPDGTTIDICSDDGKQRVMSGLQYRIELDAYRALDQIPHRVMTAAEYRDVDFVDAQHRAVQKPALRPRTFSVAVRTPETMRTGAEGLLLLESTIDLTSIETVDENVLALLLGPCSSCGCGADPSSALRIIHRARTGKIAYKTAYFIDHETGEARPNLYNFERAIDHLLGPVPGANIFMSISSTVDGPSRPTGQYIVRYRLPPSPCNLTSYTTMVGAEIQLDAFDPQMKRPVMYDVTLETLLLAMEACNLDMGAVSPMMGIRNQIPMGTTVTNRHSVNFGLQAVLLAGDATIQNVPRPPIALLTPMRIPVGDDTTTYDARRATFTSAVPPADMDLDGDGRADVTRLNDGVVEVWLGTHRPETDPPDLTRLPDRAADLTDRGLVAAINSEDLQATDIFVYRVSTMQRVGARRGILGNDVPLWTPDFIGEPNAYATPAGLQFHMLFEGPRPFFTQVGYAYRQWGAHTGMDAALIGQPSGHLTPGEPVKIYLLNRATGYIGSGYATVAGIEGQLTFRPDEAIVMTPPNLRIRAERTLDPTVAQGRENQLVGYEGSSTTRDKYVRIITDWRDNDGSPLPPDLPGFTGRLAKVVAPGRLGAVDGALAQFSIVPGQHTQQVSLADEGAEGAHFYLHVHPMSMERNPDFSAAPGTAGRPARYVPVLVPIYDEATTWEQRRRAREQEEDEEDEEETDEVPAVYAWVYRPEMQFSMFDLDVQTMARTTEDGQRITTVLSEDQAHLLFSGTDQRVEFLYSLLADEFPPLETFGPERELIFAIGGQEVRAQIGASGSLEFDNLETLTDVSSDDLLSLRLYQNGDDENVLWQSVMEYLAIDNRLIGDPREEQVEGSLVVTPENPTIDLQATLLGYAGRDANAKDPSFSIDWSLISEGAAYGQLSEVATDREMGTSTAKLEVTSGHPGDRIIVLAQLASDDMVRARFEVVIAGGEPHSFSSTLLTGDVSALGVGEAEVVVGCQDQWGNPVPDGTSIDMTLSGDAELIYEAPATPPQDPLLANGGPGTVNGEVRVKLKAGAIPTSGGVRPDDDTNELAKLHVQAGALTHDFEFEIHPLQITLTGDWGPSDLPLMPGTPHTVTATVRDWHGNAVPGAVVQWLGTRAVMPDGEPSITDNSGRASVRFGTGYQTVSDARVVATVGFAGRASLTYAVGAPNAPLDVSTTMLVGDRATDGSVDYTRPDDSVVALPYRAHGQMTVRGTPGSSVDLQLGDLTDPNIQPVAAFYMYGIGENDTGALTAPDENGLHDGIAEGIAVVDDSIMGAGRSYLFRKAHSETDPGTGQVRQVPASRIVVGTHASMEPSLANGVGFRVEVKPSEHNVPVFRHRGDVQRLSIDENGFVVYRVRTLQGSTMRAHEVRSTTPVSLNQWHAIAGRFRASQLELVVDGVASPVVSVPTSETFPFSGASEIVIGDGYEGGMKSLNWYDWSAPNLTTFADGSTRLRVVFDPTGQATVQLRSTGQLNQRPGNATMGTLRVAARFEAVGGGPILGFLSEQRQLISLISVDAYLESASAVAESSSLYNGLPDLGPIHFTSVQRSWLGQAVPTAHAQVTGAGIWDIAVELFNWIIPVNDAIAFGTQVYKLITGADDFSWSELALSAIGVLSIVPVLKPLKPVAKVLRKVMALTRGSRFIKHLASALKKAVDFIVSARGQAILDIAPFLIIIAEIAANEEDRELILFMVNSIGSADDLMAWISYFNLPLGGWAEGTDPPPVGLTSANEAANDHGVTFAALTNTIPVAHAQVSEKAARVGAAAIRTALRTFREAIQETGVNPDRVLGLLRTIRANRKEISRDITRMLRDPSYLKMQVRLAKEKGEAAIKRAMRDDPDDRIRVREIAGISAYLAAMAASGELSFGSPQATTANLATALSACFIGIPNKQHGARFQYLMMAELHLIGEGTDSELVGYEDTVSIPFFQTKEKRASAGSAALFSYNRRVDLVTREGGEEIWWEVKSLIDGAEQGGSFQPWNLGQAAAGRAANLGSGGDYHREFVGDRSAMLRKLDDVLDTDDRAPSSVNWVFHKFTTRSGARSLDTSSASVAARNLCENPIASRDQIFGAFGKGPSAAERQCGATKNPVGLLLIEEGGLPIDVEHITVHLRDLSSRLLQVLTAEAHLPVLE